MHRSRPETGGNVVRVGAGWSTGAFWALVLLVVFALAAASQLRIDRYEVVPTARADDGRLVVLAPEPLAPDLIARGHVEVAGEATTIVSGRAPALDPGQVADRYGVLVTGPSIPLVTEARGIAGQSRIFVGSEPVLVALVPGLAGLFGDE